MKLLLLILPLSLFAQLNIVATYPYIGALTKSIAGNNAKVTVLSKGNWDPHFIVPKPSLISKVRAADGLIMNGAQLEIGWLPPLIKKAANPKTKVNAPTFLNLSHHIDLINKPVHASRAGGDVHPEGNSHFHLDPNNIPILANVIRVYLSKIDYKNVHMYEENYNQFISIWKEKLKIWESIMQTKKGMKVVQYHDVLAYFTKAYGLKTIATVEPLPGIPPSSKHTFKLIQAIKENKASCILHDVYHQTKTAKYIASKTGIPIILIPHDVGAIDSVEDLISLFDYLTSAIK